MRGEIIIILQAMNKAFFVLFLFAMFSPKVATGEQGFIEEAEARDTVRRLRDRLDVVQIWYLRPLDRNWSRFEWNLLDGDRERRVKKALRDCVVFEDAGISRPLDLRFEDADKRGQGVIVIKKESEMTGLLFEANYESKKSLKLVPIAKFSEKDKKVELRPQRGFMGILLSSDVRDLLR